MNLHPVLGERLSAALEPLTTLSLTRREAQLPALPGKAHAVIGMRRAGKTTFLRQLLAERRTGLPPERAIYLSFDDDRLAGIGAEQLGFLVEEYYRRHPALRGRELVYWFLDEIQLMPGWERFVRRVLNTEKMEIVVSGSSAKMLSREVHTSLRGRGLARSSALSVFGSSCATATRNLSGIRLAGPSCCKYVRRSAIRPRLSGKCAP